MKKTTTAKSAFFYLRTSIALLLVLAAAVLALLGISQFSVQAQRQANSGANAINPTLIPTMFDCSQLHALGLDRQENFRAGAIMIYCGESKGGSPDAESGSRSFAQEILSPLLGTTDVDLVTGPDTGTHITQSETFAWANPDDPNQIVVAYNDSRGVGSFPINLSGVSVSSDGGDTFTRVTKTTGQSPFSNTLGDPVVLYNRPSGTWFTAWIDLGCGSQGIGGYKSTNPSDPNSWTHYCVHTGSFDDRESGWADNNPSSPFYGHMYVSWNDFAVGGNLKVRSSTDNGLTWGNEKQLTSGTFIRDVQITGDLATGTVYVAGMDEGGGGLANRINKIFRSTDGGNTWTNTYTGPSFPAPGSTLCASNTYFACMFNGPSFWRHMGWGQPAALNGIVHYVYDSKSGSDTANVYYIRSTDGGATFSDPIQLNTDTTTRPQWQPNVSVAEDGTVLAVWYDGRESTNCVKGDENTPCYRMWARKSLDNGATWQPDAPFSDVVSPLPGQPDSNIVTEYAGDYDYSSSVVTQHLHTWTDGRVPVNSASQQDPFFDREPASGGSTTNLTSAASRVTHGEAGPFDINMPLTGTSGVEDRDTNGKYLAVFTFDRSVVSGSASVVSGTANVGTPVFDGNEMQVPLTGVTNEQIVTIRISDVNGGGGNNDVDFGFLIGDADASRVVDRADFDLVRSQVNQAVTQANFREDVTPNGLIRRADLQTVRQHRGDSLP